MAIPFGIEGSDSLVNGVGEVFAAGERLVCEMMPLQIAPYSLDGIELRGIFWQPFDAEPGRAGWSGRSVPAAPNQRRRSSRSWRLGRERGHADRRPFWPRHGRGRDA